MKNVIGIAVVVVIALVLLVKAHVVHVPSFSQVSHSTSVTPGEGGGSEHGDTGPEEPGG